MKINQSSYTGLGYTKWNRLYEDNPDFCRERLKFAYSCAKKYLYRTSTSGENLADTTIITQSPKAADEGGFNLELAKYDSYIKPYENG